MGNCLVHEEKLVKVVKMDGKIVEYQSPLKVDQVLSEFTNHVISDTFPVHHHLSPDSDMLGGRLYYLLPSNEKEEESKQGIVRIKIVITKQELMKMLDKGGIVSVDDMISQLQNKQRNDVDGDRNSSGWKPILRSIPE